MAINFRGFLFQDDGDAVNGATVQLLETGTTNVEASTTTDSNGLWYFSEPDQDRYDVKITSGTSIRYHRWDSQIQVKEIDVRNNTGNTTPAVTFTNLTNNAGNDIAHFRSLRGTGADNDEMFIKYYMDDASSNTTEVARMTVKLISASAASEDSEIRWGVAVGGSIVDVLTISNTSGGATDMTMDVEGDITLDANGGDIFFKDGGTTFGSATNSSGNLILKSGTTTALTFSGANLTAAGTIGSGAITSTGLVTGVGVTSTGDFTTTGQATDWDLIDNNASALSFDASGKTGILDIVTTNSSEGVTMSGTLGVTGTATLATVDIGAGAIDGTAIGATSASTIVGTTIDATTDFTIGTTVITDDSIVMTPSTSDTITIAGATNGALNITTVDNAAAAANIQITADGTAELAGTTVTLDSAGDIELEATNDVKLPNNIGLIFGDAGEKIEGDGTDLTISYSGAFNVTGSAPGEATFTTGNFIVDSTGDITLDAAGHDILLKAAGTSFGNLTNDSTNFEIKSTVSDKDMIFKGNDGGSEINALTFDMSAAGSAVFGAATAAQSVEGAIPQVQIHGTSSATTRMVIGSFQANGNEGRMQFLKSRNATIGSSTIVQDGDNLGQITFCADDGTDYVSVGARIMASIDGTPGEDDTPGRLVFHTTPDDSQGTTERMRIDSTGSVLIGDTANANQTVGLTLNMGANDNEILTLKSSDVTHAMTAKSEADTFGTFDKSNNTQGALNITGFSSGTRGLQLVGNHTTDTATKSSSGNSAVVVRGNLRDGTGTTAIAANNNIFSIRSSNVVFIVDADGDVHYDGTTNASDWDDYDDIALLDTVRAVTTKNYKGVFSNFTEEHTEVLDKTGVITMNDDGHHFISTKGLNGLIIDSIRQLSMRTQEGLEELKEENKQLRQKLEALEV